MEKQGEHGWLNPWGTRVPAAPCCALPWGVFSCWWLQHTIKPLSLRLPGPIQLGMKQCWLFGCCRINSPWLLPSSSGVEPLSPVLFGVLILVTSPGMSPCAPR